MGKDEAEDDGDAEEEGCGYAAHLRRELQVGRLVEDHQHGRQEDEGGEEAGEPQSVALEEYLQSAYLGFARHIYCRAEAEEDEHDDGDGDDEGCLVLLGEFDQTVHNIYY